MKTNYFDSGTAAIRRESLPLFDIGPYKGCKPEFKKYDEEHRGTWLKFQAVALKWINRGITRIGAKAIFEEIRVDCRRNNGEEFALNNTFSSDYARKFVNLHPQYEDLFELRKTKNEH